MAVRRPEHRFSIRVPSTSFHRLEYDLDTQVLVVHFRNGFVYAYDHVRPFEMKRLLTAESFGAHFNRHIRDRHRFRRLRQGES